ncbi:MAG: MBOAT family protein [Anaerolineae bacterium]|nr:MBOAT family protein [Anaerolineae bacterium]
MSIISVGFALFTCVVLLLYYILPHRQQNYLLLAASLLFLSFWSYQVVMIFVFLTLANYLVARRVRQEDNKHARVFLWIGIALNLFSLAYLKYNDFFFPYVAYYLRKTGVAFSLEGLKLLLPVGLSFYVVQAVAYLLDIFKGVARPVASLADFALFMLYFPKLISGPIERSRDLMPKLESPRVVNWGCLERSFSLIVVGLVRKLVIADGLFLLFPERTFIEPQRFSAPHLMSSVLFYAFMIYNDFAGYTSIVRGISGLLGIELSHNFNTPYFSRNFTEFWQRWHITLSNWLRDYIFMPLTRGLLRRGFDSRHPLTLILPPFVTMFVSALWHNASGGMLLWGGLHALCQVIERLFALWRKKGMQHFPARWQQSLAILLVFALTVLAWVPFRMEIPIALQFYKEVFRFSLSGEMSIPALVMWISLFLVALSLMIDLPQYRRGESVFVQQPPLVKAALINIAIVLLTIGIAAHLKAPPPFIYQAF